MINLHELADFLNMDSSFIEKKFKEQFPSYQGLSPISKKLAPAILRKFLDFQDVGIRQQCVTIAALKGGIGKTFLTTNVAIRLSMLGAKVLIIDLDPQACASNSLVGEEFLLSEKKLTILEIIRHGPPLEQAIIPTRYDGLSILPSSLRVAKAERAVYGKNPKTLLKNMVEELDFDFIFFELPPSFSNLSASAYLASDQIIIPCTPNIHSLESIDLTIQAVTEVAKEFECPLPQFRVLLNRYCLNRNASQDTLTLLKDDHSDILYSFYVRESAMIQNAINSGLSIYENQHAYTSTTDTKNVKAELDQLVKMLRPFVLLSSQALLKKNAPFEAIPNTGLPH